jgi:hypothetical protein
VRKTYAVSLHDRQQVFPKNAYRFCDRTMHAIKKSFRGFIAIRTFDIQETFSFGKFFLIPHIENCDTSPLRHKTA